MSRLAREPSGPVETMSQLGAIARERSLQAIALYRSLAESMAELGNETARAAFADLEAMQREHAAPAAGEDLDAAVAIFEDEDIGGARLATPYAAFSLAVRNEERAFAFWTHISAHSENPEVRAAAERLARDEMERIKALRSARRRAYHDGRASQPDREDVRVATPAALRRQAAAREAALAALHGRLAAELAGRGHPAAEPLAAIAREEAASAAALGASAEPEHGVDPLPQEAAQLVALAVEHLEIAVELYLATSEQAQDEDVVAAAQDLAATGIARLARLR